MDKLKILHLTLKRKWFDLIARGEKKIEYRVIKPYWVNRLVKFSSDNDIEYGCYDWRGYYKHFDEIHFRNGYRKDSPFMRVGYIKTIVRDGKFNIYLGEILEIRNWDG